MMLHLRTPVSCPLSCNRTGMKRKTRPVFGQQIWPQRNGVSWLDMSSMNASVKRTILNLEACVYSNVPQQHGDCPSRQLRQTEDETTPNTSQARTRSQQGDGYKIVTIDTHLFLSLLSEKPALSYTSIQMTAMHESNTMNSHNTRSPRLLSFLCFLASHGKGQAGEVVRAPPSMTRTLHRQTL
jgi:hypothetical protein